MAEVERGQLDYELVGEGVPVVFLHGFSFDHRMWNPQVEELARRFQVIRYDMRGYGTSSIPDGTYSHSEDLAALLTSLSIEKAHVVGLSLGGAIAVDFAIAHPHRAISLVVVDAAIAGYPRSKGSSAEVLKSIARSDGIEAARQYWLSPESLLATSLRKADVAQLVGQMVSQYSGWHLLNSDPGHGINPPAIDRLGEINVPTLVVVGEQDAADFQQMANALHLGIPDSMKALIPDAGHLPNLEQPEVFNRLLLNFLISGECVA